MAAGVISPPDWFFIGGFALIVVGGGVRIWRGHGPALRDEPAAWPWGGVAWRAYVRCLRSMVVVGIAFLVVLAVLATVPEGPDDPSARPLVWTGLAALALSVLVMLCVAFFNRPKCLVSRGLRQEPGAATELLARRRRRRPSKVHESNRR